MKKNLLVSIFLFGFIYLVNAQTVIIIQHGNTSTAVYNGRLDIAVSIAQAGDILYLSGGRFTVGGTDIHIPQKLSIIGTGYNTDSSVATKATFINANIYFDSSSSGSTLCGTNILGTVNIVDKSASNITIANNYINGKLTIGENVDGGYYGGSNALINENIISSINIFTSDNFIIQKNVFIGIVQTQQFTNAYFMNNLFLARTLYGDYWPAKSCSNFYNNVVYSTDLAYTLAYGAVNNLIVYNTSSLKSTNEAGAYGNIDLYDSTPNLSKLFVKYISGNWIPSWNLHLAINSVGHNAGNDGTDVGIYGTETPFKDGGMPFNPHIQSANIVNAPDGSGNLRVNIKVTAQKN